MDQAQLPPNWKLVQLGNIAKVVSGGTPARDKPEYWNGTVSWVKTGEIKYNIIRHTEEKITQAGLEASSARMIPAGTLLMAMYGQGVTRGRVAILGIDAAINQACAAILATEDVFTEFLFFSLTYRYEKIRDLGHGANQKNLNAAFVKSVEITLPPLEEQKAIAHTLQTIQNTKAARQRELDLERERKAALMQHLFTYGTRNEPQKMTAIGAIPESWFVLPLEKVAKIERGKFAHRPRNAPEFYGGNIPFIQTGDVTLSDGRIQTYTQTLNEKGLAVSRIFPKGTIVITIAANIGYTGILEFDSAFPDSLIGITPINEVQKEYLNYYLSTQQKKMDSQASQGTQKNINIEFLRPWLIVVPSWEEQSLIVEILHNCDRAITTIEQEISLLDELFRAMLEELMTGHLLAVSSLG